MQIFKKKVVPSQGIEPRFPGRKSGVLPLYYVGQVHQIKVGQSPPEMPKHRTESSDRHQSYDVWFRRLCPQAQEPAHFPKCNACGLPVSKITADGTFLYHCSQPTTNK